MSEDATEGKNSSEPAPQPPATPEINSAPEPEASKPSNDAAKENGSGKTEVHSSERKKEGKIGGDLMPEREEVVAVDRWGMVLLKDNIEKFDRTKPPTDKEIEWELKWASMVGKWDKYKEKLDQNNKVKKRVRLGIADSVRASIWPRLCNADVMLEKFPGLYQKLLTKKLKQKDEEQLHKDLHRTDPRNIIFYNKGLGQESLYNVLKAYCLYDPKVGYCQGMGALAGLLLTYVPEETAFWMMVRLMSDRKYACAGLYSPGFPELFKHMAMHDKLLYRHDKKLYKCLQAKHVQTGIYAFRWYQGRFYEFPKELFIRVMDIFLLEGRKIVFRVALYLLMSHRKEFFAADDEKALRIARDLRDDPYTKKAPDAAKLIEKALEVNLTRHELAKVEKEYEESLKDGKR
uniref:Rab-GAP TBC domain-containing protein n=2 Tax=Lotharella globosa TaxID=91324 RepID=A0A7S3ZD37_9EUKA|mmetsp:Transcript_14853/g.30137  ORF Transcript_14853/g.30137 Transcript_14853/m.30137 type:complete len:403 (-) Transcript_14853:159-1367(-)|eukprot:CAMPEP_0167781910 /NCGR_PEP_ID=MMETSP0111_2-20121227/6211_1 /TAXON_ID=91324 /ORGANISM="Lotharella globosa, Strain CCCM811" /LENGTH=402 /DNA_ID=CAMNT_0007672657 /DNA_START=35 /DNA_END=1243 /DNA_ORIENTATION=-